MPEAKRPTHDLSVILKDGTKGKIGVAWLNDDGSVSIQLNACTTLDSREVERLTLFKREAWKGKTNQRSAEQSEDF